MKRKRSRTRLIIMLVLSVEALLIVLILVYIQLKPKVVKAVTIEAGSQMVDVGEFLQGINTRGSYLTDINSLNLNNPGIYDVQIKVGNKILNSSLEVVDTIPPTAKAADQTIIKDNEIDAQAFVTDIIDSTPVTVSFKTAPDFSKSGDQEVTIVLADTSNNQSELKVKLIILDINKKVTIAAGTPMNLTAADFVNNDDYKVTFETNLQNLDISKPATHDVLLNVDGKSVKVLLEVTEAPDTEPPVISGVTDKTVYIGETVSYKKGVTVTDNKDEKVDLKIDNSKVNLTKAGSYPVIYFATDAAGNTATADATITVKESIITMDALSQMSQDILDEIITEDMTEKEIAYAIYEWTRNHIAYTGSSDKSDWVAEAYRGIKNAVGDCFTYFSVSQALLNQAGIENIGLTRVGGRTHHYWSLINCGDGWYHFDATPNKDHKETFMMTEAEVQELTKIRGNNYYTYDKSLYPVSPVE